MKNMTLKMNEQTSDVEFDEDGMLQTIEGDETTAQNIRMALTAWKGDFELVSGHGTDYKKFFSERCSQEEEEEILRDAILQEEGVRQIESVEIEKSEERNVSISFSGIIGNSKGINMEVNVS